MNNSTISNNLLYIYDNDLYTNNNISCFNDLDKYALPLKDIYVCSTEARRKAIDKFYEMGYITDDEVVQLQDKGIARRNEHTIIQLEEFKEIIVISCYEYDSNRTQAIEKLFQLKYVKSSDKVDAVGQEYLLENIN
jgi:hypothetical protein